MAKKLTLVQAAPDQADAPPKGPFVHGCGKRIKSVSGLAFHAGWCKGIPKVPAESVAV